MIVEEDGKNMPTGSFTGVRRINSYWYKQKELITEFLKELLNCSNFVYALYLWETRGGCW